MQVAEGARVSQSYFGVDLKEGALWRNVLAMVAIMFILQITFQVWAIILPRYLMELGGLERRHLGKVTGSMSITYDIIRITLVGVFGALSDRFGRKSLLVLGALVSALSYLYFGYTSNLAVLLGVNFIVLLFVARVVIALSMQIITPQLLPTFFDYTKPHCRGRISSLFGFTMAFGAFMAYRVLGPVSKGLTIQEFILLGTWMSLAVLLLALFGIVDLTPAREKVSLTWRSILGTTKNSFKNFSDAWPVVRKSPGLLFTYAVAFVEKSDISIQVSFFMAWAVAVARQFHMTRAEATADAAMTISWAAFMSVTVYAIGGFIVDRFGRKFSLMFGLFLSGIAFVWLGFMDNPFVALAAVAIGLRGFGTGAASLSTYALISDLSPKELLGTIWGGYNMAAAAGMMVVVGISIFLFDYVGYGYPFVLAGGMDLAVFVWGFFLWKKIPERKGAARAGHAA
jgi:MFS family permease